MKIKTKDLYGAALDWAVAQAEGHVSARRVVVDLEYLAGDDPVRWEPQLSTYYSSAYTPSTNWTQAGPLIEQEKIEWQWIPAPDKAHQYGARKPSLGGLNRTFCMDGPTVLVAAMRCYVASQLGDEVEVPDELCAKATA